MNASSKTNVWSPRGISSNDKRTYFGSLCQPKKQVEQHSKSTLEMIHFWKPQNQCMDIYCIYMSGWFCGKCRNMYNDSMAMENNIWIFLGASNSERHHEFIDSPKWSQKVPSILATLSKVPVTIMYVICFCMPLISSHILQMHTKEHKHVLLTFQLF